MPAAVCVCVVERDRVAYDCMLYVCRLYYTIANAKFAVAVSGRPYETSLFARVCALLTLLEAVECHNTVA